MDFNKETEKHLQNKTDLTVQKTPEGTLAAQYSKGIYLNTFNER